MEMLSIHGLKSPPSTKTPTPAVTMPTSVMAEILDQPRRFWSASTGLSSRFIREVTPAKRTARKKMTANACPKGMLRMTDGIVIKRSPGPEFGYIPYANTAGMMTRPARIAANVSKNATYFALLTTSTSDFR